MDSPQDNPEGYKETNLSLRAGNLKGPPAPHPRYY